MKKLRRPLIAGNWKMNRGGKDGVALAREIAALAPTVPHVDLLIAPPFTALVGAGEALSGSGVHLAAQNMHGRPHGAFTGEVSSEMLRDAGCDWVILGHSERRHVFGEKDSDVALKVAHALDAGLCPIVCVGETLAEREAGQTLAVVGRQIEAVLDALVTDPNPEAIAYEPVWAIGTGKVPAPSDVEAVHRNIRAWLVERNATWAQATRILYGGSVTANNARELLACEDVDGLLVGGASLDASAFGAIARVAEELAAGSRG